VVKAWLNPTGDLADLSNEVGAKAACLAAAFEKGVRFLALPVEDTRDSATWILACFHSPVTVVPLPPSLPLPALENRLAQLPKGSVAFPGSLRPVKPEAALPRLRDLKEIWAVIFTSGSSGEPKGIAVSGTALKSSAFAHAEHCGFPAATWLLDLPLYHVGGLSVISRALFLGSVVAFGPPRFDQDATAAWIQSGRVQGLSLVPTTLFRLLQNRVLDFTALKLILLGGDSTPREIIAEATDRQAPVRLTYGMTEHASQIATEKNAGSGLEPLPGVEIQIASDGEIFVRSECLALGFFRGGELVPLPLENGFYGTGDLGAFCEGKLTHQGRKSEMIVSGGMKVFPMEVEGALAKVQGVQDCAVSSMPDKEWGEVLCALVVETEPGKFDSALAKESLARILETRKIPKIWSIVELIPRSPTGKILRSELLNRLKSSIAIHS